MKTFRRLPCSRLLIPQRPGSKEGKKIYFLVQKFYRYLHLFSKKESKHRIRYLCRDKEKSFMAFSSWLCTKNTKKMFVKIVHPGGHVELHDRPVLAAEVMLQNPRCCIAYPHVFQQPSAVVPPDTTLMPGQKYYVVPVSTIKKLRMRAPAQRHRQHTQELKSRKKTRWPFSSRKSTTRKQPNRNDGKEIGSGNCFSRFLAGIMSRAGNSAPTKDVAAAAATNSGSSEATMLPSTSKKKNNDEESPSRIGSFNGWHPNLEIISEE